MSQHHTTTVDSDISLFTNSLPPPPPYSVSGNPVDERPVLPEIKRNAHLNARKWHDPVDLDEADLTVPADAHIVKFQTIVRDGREIVVGRIKVPTVSVDPSSDTDTQPGTHTHAFVLRRYDTNAISLTTMFKVAFPGATEVEETREMEWVRP
jgi:hypothetical protein